MFTDSFRLWCIFLGVVDFEVLGAGDCWLVPVEDVEVEVCGLGLTSPLPSSRAFESPSAVLDEDLTGKRQSCGGGDIEVFEGLALSWV